MGREELQPHIYPHEEVQTASYLTGLLGDICFLLPFLLSPISRENFYLDLTDLSTDEIGCNYISGVARAGKWS